MSLYSLTSATSTLAANNPSLMPAEARSAAIIGWAKATCQTWASDLPVNTSSISWAGLGSLKRTQAGSSAEEDSEDDEGDGMVPGGGGAKLYGPEEEKTRVTQEVKTLTELLFSQRIEGEDEEEYKNRQALQRLISLGTTRQGGRGEWDDEQGSEWILKSGKVSKV